MAAGDGVCDSMARTLVEAALQVLNTEDPMEKAQLTAEVAARWQQGAISTTYGERDAHLLVPDRPCRLSNVKLVSPSLMPKLGKGGSLRSRQAIVHSLVHTESWAIDLSWDIIARFGRREAMPDEFFADFVKVAEDEARHFTLLAARLQEMGSHYGAFPAHDGLWDSAIQTSQNLLARLAVEHCVHEARGLDVLPTTISRFRKGGDEQTASLLETVVYPEEITHCAAGVKWFRYLCQRDPVQQATTTMTEDISAGENLSECLEVHKGDSQDIKTVERSFRCMETQSDEQKVIQCFHSTVRKHFRGPLKPPFNAEARKAANFEPAWYEPLVVRDE